MKRDILKSFIIFLSIVCGVILCVQIASDFIMAESEPFTAIISANSSSVSEGDALMVDINYSVSYEFDEYIAIVLPSGDFFCLDEYDNLVGPNWAVARSTGYTSYGTVRVFDYVMPDTSVVPEGSYEFYVVCVSASADPLDMNNWISWDSIIVNVTEPNDETAPYAVASPAGGTYSSAQHVSLTAYTDSSMTAEESSANIYYTLDGSEPTTESTEYSSPITLTSNTNLKFFAVDLSGNAQDIVTESYVISIPSGGGGGPSPTPTPAPTPGDTTAPYAIASVDGGRYAEAQTITLTAYTDSTMTTEEPTAVIYYTVDGKTPTTDSTVYITPITISENGSLKYFAVDESGNAQEIMTEVYFFDADEDVVASIYYNGNDVSWQEIKVTLNFGSTTEIVLDASNSIPVGATFEWSSLQYEFADSTSATQTLSIPATFMYPFLFVDLTVTHDGESAGTMVLFIFER